MTAVRLAVSLALTLLAASGGSDRDVAWHADAAGGSRLQLRCECEVSGVDVFSYTITDSDGDTDTTTRDNHGYGRFPLGERSGVDTVDEAALDTVSTFVISRFGGDGSAPSSTTETVTGTLDVTRIRMYR